MPFVGWRRDDDGFDWAGDDVSERPDEVRPFELNLNILVHFCDEGEAAIGDCRVEVGEGEDELKEAMASRKGDLLTTGGVRSRGARGARLVEVASSTARNRRKDRRSEDREEGKRSGSSTGRPLG